MNLKEYKENKLKRKELLDKEELLFRTPCLKCLRPVKICLCKDIEAVKTRSIFIILIHPMEAKKEKVATGRLAHLCLENSKLVTGIDFTNDKQVNSYINDDQYLPFLLYPGDDSVCITNNELSLDRETRYQKTPVFFIIDATWPHAKSMMKKSVNLHKLKRVSFYFAGKSKFIIKQQPSENCLCTIESIYYLIEGLNKFGHENIENKKHTLLLTKLEELVNFQISCTLNPDLKSYRKGNFKPPEERPYSKKWEGRSICFEEKFNK